MINYKAVQLHKYVATLPCNLSFITRCDEVVNNLIKKGLLLSICVPVTQIQALCSMQRTLKMFVCMYVSVTDESRQQQPGIVSCNVNDTCIHNVHYWRHVSLVPRVKICTVSQQKTRHCQTAGTINLHSKLTVDLQFTTTYAGCSAFWYITRTLYCMQNTVKPLMLTYPLFREFCEPNKTTKLKGANIDYIATLIDNLGVDKWWLTQSLNHQMQYFTRVLLLVMRKLWLKSITH